MKHELRSSMSTEGRRMAGARALWVANGMKKEMMGKPIIAVVNSFTQFVPGHTHLHEIGQMVKAEIERLGCFAAEFNTIAIDDGIELRQDYAGDADGCHEAEHPYRFRIGRTDGSGRVGRHAPRPD